MDKSASTVRVAVVDGSTNTAEEPWPTVTLLALAPLLMASLFLAWRWREIPQRFPIHWAFNGTANGWASRSGWTIFGPPIAGAVLVVAFAWLGRMAERYSHGFSGKPVMVRTTAGVLCAAAWLISLIFCALSGLALVKKPTVVVPAIIAVALCGSFAVVAAAAYGSRRIPTQVRLAAEQTTDDRH